MLVGQAISPFIFIIQTHRILVFLPRWDLDLCITNCPQPSSARQSLVAKHQAKLEEKFCGTFLEEINLSFRTYAM